MKKLLIAAMAASIVMAFTGCGSDEESSSKADTTTTTTTAAEDVDAPAADDSEADESEATEESAADPVEIADPVESEIGGDVSEAETEIGDDFTSGKFFTFEADDTKWSTTEDAFGNTTVTYMGTDIPEATATCFMLFNSEEAEDLQEFTFDELAPLFVSSMGLGDDFVIEEEGSADFNGYDAYIIDGTYTQSGTEFAIKLILCREDTKLVVVATMAYSEAAEAIQPEFQTVLDTVKIV